MGFEYSRYERMASKVFTLRDRGQESQRGSREHTYQEYSAYLVHAYAFTPQIMLMVASQHTRVRESHTGVHQARWSDRCVHRRTTYLSMLGLVSCLL